MFSKLFFDKLTSPGKTQRTYRHPLKLMLDWIEQQDWCPWEPVPRSPTSRKREKRGSATFVRVTQRTRIDEHKQPIYKYEYGLGAVEEDVIPEKLKQDIAAFYRFRTDPKAGNREGVVKPITAKSDVTMIGLLLGWLHRHQGISLEELSLKKLVEFVDKKPIGNAHVKDAQRSLRLPHDYLDWLQTDPTAKDSQSQGRGSNSTHTKIAAYKVLIAITKYVYDSDIKASNFKSYDSIPEIAQLRLGMKTAQKQLKSVDVAKEAKENEKQWLDWTEFLEFVEALRQHCEPYNIVQRHTHQGGVALGPLRPVRAIAFSYQQFLLSALMAYLPPRRSRNYRFLQIEEPNSEDQQEIGGYFCYEDEKWNIYWLTDTNKGPRENLLPQYSKEKEEVPNIRYLDGKSFYQYLNEWLLKYQYEDASKRMVTIDGLRSVFKPDHPYFFSQKQGIPYSNSNGFRSVLQNPAYRLTGKVPNLEMIRDMFSEYIQNSCEYTTMMYQDVGTIAQNFINPNVPS